MKLHLTQALELNDGTPVHLVEQQDHIETLIVRTDEGHRLYFYQNGKPHIITQFRYGNVELRNVEQQSTDQVDVIGVVRKIVVGLRGLASESTAIDAGTHSDRINGYAAELADAIGFEAEPAPVDPDLIAARDMAVKFYEPYLQFDLRIIAKDIAGKTVMTNDASGIIAAIRGGQLDTEAHVTSLLQAIKHGRASAVVASAPAPVTPDRLTVSIDGPQGSGKTRLAHWLVDTLEGRSTEEPRSVGRLNPAVIEMRDGREFDVRNDVFLG